MLKRWPFVVMSCLFATGGFVLYDHGWLQDFDTRLQDRLLTGRPASEEIVIVAIDNRSIEELGIWPWPRGLHADMIETLVAAEARAIGYDVTFADPGPGTAADSELAGALQATSGIVLASEAVIELRQGMLPLVVGAVVPDEQFQGASFGPTTLVPGADGLVRQVPLAVDQGEVITSFATQVFEKFSGHSPEQGTGMYRIAYAGGPGHFARHSFADVLKGVVPAETFQDKIVFVGSTAPDLHDEFLTPMGGGAMPGVEIQANILQSLLEGRNLRTLSRAEAGVVFMVLTLATILLGLFLPMRYAALSSAALGLAYLIVAVGLSSQDILLPIVYPFGLITGVTTFDVLYRYKDEHNRRRFIEHAFGRYVAPAVVEKLVKGETPLALGGSKQELTILFSDIRGFTSLSEKLPPEELVKFLNSYLTAMSNVVLGAQGTIDKFIGDALMAFWGAPVAQEHQAVRAVLAALHMRKVLTEFNWRALKNGQPAIEIGIGINTGEVIVGNMGSERRFDYTVIGDDVNLASRLESLTKFYGVGILITKATKDKLGDGFLTRMVDIVAVKGKQLPVRVYEVIADLEEATPAEKEFVLKSYQALELYYDKKFAEAEPKFVELGNVIFAERCRTYIINPPGEDWVGVFIAQDK